MNSNIDEIIKSPQWSESQEKLITGPFNYLTKTPGKHLRTQLIQLFNLIYKIPQDRISQISHIIEILHTSSLLIDDVEDDSNLRRGKPTAHLIYGIPYTINSSNYMYFRALQELIQLDPNLVYVFNEELLNLHRGQSLDLYWRENLSCPNEDEYINMVMNKTGGLFRLAIRLMENFSEFEKISLIPLANLLGIIYQIKDDYMNLKSESLLENKGFCEDLSEGKLSFPIIHSLKANPMDQTLLGILKQRTNNDDIKKFALSYLEKTDSFVYTEKTLGFLGEKAIDWIDQIQEESIKNELQEIKTLIIKLSSI